MQQEDDDMKEEDKQEQEEQDPDVLKQQARLEILNVSGHGSGTVLGAAGVKF